MLNQEYEQLNMTNREQIYNVTSCLSQLVVLLVAGRLQHST